MQWSVICWIYLDDSKWTCLNVKTYEYSFQKNTTWLRWRKWAMKRKRRFAACKRLTFQLKRDGLCTTPWPGDFETRMASNLVSCRSTMHASLTKGNASSCWKNLWSVKTCHPLNCHLVKMLVQFFFTVVRFLLESNTKGRSSCRSVLRSAQPLASTEISHQVAAKWCWDPRESSKKNEDVYEKVPLFDLQERFGSTEGGRSADPDFLVFWNH